MTGQTIEVWIAMNESGDYEVGRDEDSAVDRLDVETGCKSRRTVMLRVMMSVPVATEADVVVPDEAGQTVKVEID